MTTLYLIRHGETTWNVDGRFQGQQDVPLSPRGREQAYMTAQALRRYPLAAVYTSDLTRSAETAAAIARPHGLTPIPDARLREVFFGEWEGLTLPEVAVRWPEIAAAWRNDSLRTRPPGGETLEQLRERVAAAITDITARYPSEVVAIVAHGGPVRAAVTLALGVDLSIFRRLRLDNCNISTVVFEGDRQQLIRLNDICHLEPQPPHATWDEAGDQWLRDPKTGEAERG